MKKIVALLIFSFLIWNGFAKQLCNICDCVETNQDVFYIECTEPKFNFNDIEWPIQEKPLKVSFSNLETTILPFVKWSKQVRELNLANNQIASFDKKAFLHLEFIEKLSLANNSIDNIPEDLFGRMADLEELDLSLNLLKTLPNLIFQQMPKLIKLDLGQNQFQSLNENLIYAIKSIKEINLRKNDIDSIESVSMTGILIESLDLSYNKISSINNNVTKSFDKLENLNLKNNKITEIEKDAFLEAESLEELKLAGNQLKNINLLLPDNLKKLHLENNQIDSWPLENNDGSLKWLNLRNNLIFRLQFPTSIAFPLEHLELSENKLNDFPSSNFPNLKTLDLSYNLFMEIPAGLGSPETSLEELIMDGNPMEKIIFSDYASLSKVSFSNMPKIVTLDDDAFIKVSPRNSSCVDVKISNCPLLANISDKTFRKLGLCSLDLSGNKLKTISNNLANWWDITGEINLQGNPFDCNCEMEWILTEVMNKLYRVPEHQYLLDDFRCSTPEAVAGFRLVRFYKHVSPFCNANKMAEFKMAPPETASFGFDWGFNRGPSPYLIIGVCAFIMIALMVAGWTMVKEEKRRLKRNRERRLFHSYQEIRSH